MLLVRGPCFEEQKARRRRVSKGIFLLFAGALAPNSGTSSNEVDFAVGRTSFSKRRLLFLSGHQSGSFFF